MNIQLHATPYGHYEGFSGFYFSDMDDYAEKYEAAFKTHGCDEYEIQFIDGPGLACELAEAMKLSQSNLDVFFDCADSDTTILVAYVWLLSRGWNYSDAADRADDVYLFEGSVKDYAYELMEDGALGVLSDIAKRYFDYEAFARDLELGGDVDTLTVDGVNYVVTNANEF